MKVERRPPERRSQHSAPGIVACGSARAEGAEHSTPTADAARASALVVEARRHSRRALPEAEGGGVTASARSALERAWLGVLADRHPDVRWRLVRPGERGERDAVTAAGEIIGSLAAPEDERALIDRDVPTRANDNGIERGGE